APGPPEGALRRLEREQRALHAGRADLDPEKLEHVVRRHARRLVERLALDLVGEERCRRLADRAAPAGEADRRDLAVAHPQLQRDPVATQGIRALLGGGRVLEDPEVVGPAIVLEDVIAVEIVHARAEVYRPRPIPTTTLGFVGRRLT